jgi:hypothetical protein
LGENSPNLVTLIPRYLNFNLKIRLLKKFFIIYPVRMCVYVYGNKKDSIINISESFDGM